MGFPETRQTLIQRISHGGSEEDWRQLLSDYWGPLCRFAHYQGARTIDDAEDIASQVFEALYSGDLLTRWQANQTAKLRTLLCRIVRNILSNRARVEQGRKRLLKDYVDSAPADSLLPVASSEEPSGADVDAFYAAWVDDLLQQSVGLLREELHRSGKGDYFRTLYGRLCEDMTMAEISESLHIKLTDAENYFKAAKKRLAEQLQSHLRRHVERYCEEPSREDELAAEWAQLGEYLKQYGGLETAVRRLSDQDVLSGSHPRRSDSFQRTAALFAPR